MTEGTGRGSSYLAVSAKLRESIVSGEYPPGCRIPTVRELAKKFDTSVFTIQNALRPLVSEGLVEQRRPIGVFVKNSKVQLKTLGVYYGRDIWAMEELEFYRRAHQVLNERLKRTGVESALFIDDRPAGEASTPYPPLQKAIEQGRTQAVAAMIIDWERLLWFKELGIPSSFYGSANFPGRVDVEVRSFASGVLESFRKRGVKRVAFINGYDMVTKPFMETLAKLEMETRPEWTFIPKKAEDLTGRMQSWGYESFLKLWSSKEKPDALAVFPDSVCRGVIMGILAKGVKVPERLLVATHLNKGIDFPCPFPLLKSIMDPAAIVDASMEQIRIAMQGLPQGEALAPLTMEED